ncbi:hypothetical protein tf_10 [Pseudomonas phage tf]|jgi:hypothetical protein|uniref:Uncharacterized protein n=1 Tax=Pseudomonas phage tf TaxID=1114179 RepID=I2FLN1_9CAUD|nr:hypothetical protein tf_10 [Pseudomonas phage tf]CCE60765.1 hypothetical protein tf_10 [Pseudomonas phage tf]
MDKNDIFNTLSPKYAVKKKTGAIWRFIRPGVYTKVALGDPTKYSRATKEVGYMATNFHPRENPKKWLCVDSLEETSYFLDQKAASDAQRNQ